MYAEVTSKHNSHGKEIYSVPCLVMVAFAALLFLSNSFFVTNHVTCRSHVAIREVDSSLDFLTKISFRLSLGTLERCSM